MDGAAFSFLLDRATTMRIAGGLFVLWGASAWIRSLDPLNRRRLAAISALLSAWMLVVIIKWKSSDQALEAALWYAYYIPLTLVPLLCLLCAARASGLDRRPWAKAAARALWCAACALIVLVLTNDAHEQVFRFLGTRRSDAGPYEYAWGHRLVVAWSLACYGGFFGLFAAFSRARLKPLVAPIVGICAAGAAFSQAYGLAIPWAASLNFSLVYGVLVAAALELCLDLGFLASARSFAETFDALPLDLRILDRAGRSWRATRAACPLTSDVAAAAAAHAASVAPGASASFRLPAHPGRLFHLWRLSGATALLTQDVSDLDALADELGRRQEELRRTNQMLTRRGQTERILARMRAERALMGDVEQAISTSMQEVSSIFSGLPQGADAASRARRTRELQHARMILAYCKRKSSLALFEAADPELDRDRIRLIAHELACDLRAVGIDCAAVIDLPRPIPAAEMGVLYDCIYAFAFVAFSCEDPVLIYHLGGRDGDETAELRARLQSADGDDLSGRPESTRLLALLTQRDVAYSLAGGTGSLRLIARVRAGGPR